MYKDSIYNKMLQSSEKRTAMGFDYASNGLLNKWLSPMMFANPRLETFLNKIDPMFIELLDSVKRIQFFNNYTIDKNDRRYNQ
jgi:hypothetical protein